MFGISPLIARLKSMQFSKMYTNTGKNVRPRKDRQMETLPRQHTKKYMIPAEH